MYIQIALRFAKYRTRSQKEVNFPDSYFVLFHELFFPPWFLDENFKYCTDSAIIQLLSWIR